MSDSKLTKVIKSVSKHVVRTAVITAVIAVPTYYIVKRKIAELKKMQEFNEIVSAVNKTLESLKKEMKEEKQLQNRIITDLLVLNEYHNYKIEVQAKMADIAGMFQTKIQKEEVQKALYFMKFASAAYGAESCIKDFGYEKLAIDPTDHAHAISVHTGVEKDEVKLIVLDGNVTDFPRHFITLDKKNKNIIIGIRGTKSLNDALTDVCLTQTQFMDGYAHCGILRGSYAVYNSIKEQLVKIIKENPDFTVCITGHSLGGGTTILMTLILLKEQEDENSNFPKDVEIKGYAFAPPPVYGQENEDMKNIELYQNNLKVFIHNEDMVPRAHLRAIYELSLILNRIDQFNFGLYTAINFSKYDKLKADLCYKLDMYQNEIDSKKGSFKELFHLGDIYWMIRKEKDYELEKADFRKFQDLQIQTWMALDHLNVGYEKALDNIIEKFDDKKSLKKGFSFETMIKSTEKI